LNALIGKVVQSVSQLFSGVVKIRKSVSSFFQTSKQYHVFQLVATFNQHTYLSCRITVSDSNMQNLFMQTYFAKEMIKNASLS